MNRKSSVLTLVVALAVTVGILAETKSEESSRSSGKSSPSRSGAVYYERLCSGCHGSDGLASTGEAPPLAGSAWVSGPEGRLVRIVMHGMKGPIQVADKIYDREMPGVGGRLSDPEMASLLSFVRSRWGASGVALTPETVKRVRTASRKRTRYWTVEELLAVR